MFDLAFYFSQLKKVMNFGDIFDKKIPRNLSPNSNSNRYLNYGVPISEKNEALFLTKFKVIQRE